MADKIQLTIESFVPELDALFHKGVFEKKEVRKIIKKRRYHEYQFEKKNVTQIDFFKAIRYEKIIHKRFIAKKKELKITKTDYFDFHCNIPAFITPIVIRRIIVLFKKCLQKFGDDEKIWLEFFNFLIKHNSLKILNKEIGGALVKHQNNLTFWKIAAYNELENNFNSITARQLMQKCIRLNNTIEAYVEYFVFEIVFAHKYLERKTVMSSSVSEDQSKLKIIDEVNEEDDNVKKNTVEGDGECQKYSDDITNLKVAELVWLKAIEKYHTLNCKEKTVTDINLLFLNRLEKYGRRTNFAQLEQEIIQTIMKDNPNDISIQTSIVTCKLEKYLNEEDYIYHMIVESTSLLTLCPNEVNQICLLLLQHILARDNKEALLPHLFKVFNGRLNVKKLVENCFQGNNSLPLIEALTSLDVMPHTREHINKEHISLNVLISEVYLNIINEGREDCIEAIFRIISNLSGEEYDYSKIFLVKLTSLSDSFILKYIRQAISAIPKVVTYDPDLQITLDYFNKLNAQLSASKRTLDNQCYKCLYEEILRVIMKKITENDEVNADHRKAIAYIKEEMNLKLISFDYAKKNIITSFTTEQKKLIEQI